MEELTTELSLIEKDENFASLQTKADKAIAWANKLVIKTQENLEKANEGLLLVKEEYKYAEAARKEHNAPYEEKVKRVNAIFKPWTEKLKEAITVVNTKMVDWHNEQERKAREAEEKIRKQVEAGKLTLEQGAKKLEKAPEPEKTTRTESGAMATFVVRKVAVVEDWNEETQEWETEKVKIPIKYLVPDLRKIEFDLKRGVRIPGASLVERKTTSSRRSIPF
jgi:small-conductance mechanosensitive channel